MTILENATHDITLPRQRAVKWLQPSIHIASLALFFAAIAPIIAPSQNGQQLASTTPIEKKASSVGSGAEAKIDQPARAALHDGALFIGAYGGAPYTYSSDVRTIRPNGTDFTLHDVDWYGKPFKSPVYYGVRIAKWSEIAPFGAMLDFTHSKTISDRRQEVRQSGKYNNTPMPPRAKISDTFRKLEFSHGHNMLTLNGLYRLPVKIASISPYMGLGAGISIPHSEIRFKGDLIRTYEYQYTGPAFQALFGLEFQLPKYSIFLEYKFTFADYQAPLTYQDGSWVIQDLWAQFQNWRAGKSGKEGSLSTKLASHQLIGGLGIRIIRNAAH